MKLAAVCALALLLLSCSSSTAVIDQRTLNCDPGQDVSIQAGIDGNLRDERIVDDRLDLVVEVTNNSHEEVTVNFIRIDQNRPDEAVYVFENAYREFDQVIPENGDHTFHLPSRGKRGLSNQDARSITAASSSQGIEMAVTVALSNGDSYRCSFAVPVR